MIDYAEPVLLERLPVARALFPCCDNRRRSYTAHRFTPKHLWDGDWTMCECNSCGAVLTVGDMYGHDSHDELRSMPYGSAVEVASVMQTALLLSARDG